MLKTKYTFQPSSYPFNPSEPRIMHIDINSCFATIEQQARPHLRGKPIVVAAYKSPYSIILAASIEAKQLGIKGGMSVREAQKIFPQVLVFEPDAPKYRSVHIGIKNVLESYTPHVYPKSIDEFSLNFTDVPITKAKSIQQLGQQIKDHIRQDVGEWISTSVGISTNRFLAKQASNIKKPDGLSMITKNNYQEVYENMAVTKLTGIKIGNGKRLHTYGIYTVSDLYNAPLWRLRAAFHSITSYYWYLRIRGWEIDDEAEHERTMGHSYVLPKEIRDKESVYPILCKLIEKLGSRLRRKNYHAHGLSLAIRYQHTSWSDFVKSKGGVFDSRDLLRLAVFLLKRAPYDEGLRAIAITSFYLEKEENLQLSLLENIEKKKDLSRAIDKIQNRFGLFSLTSGRMAYTEKYIPDRIAFGRPHTI